PLWLITESEPTFAQDDGKWFLWHQNEVIWSQDILILLDATPGRKVLPFSIDLLVCDDNGCLPGKIKFEAVFEVSDEPAVALTPDLEKRSKLDRPPMQVVPVPGKEVPADLGSGGKAKVESGTSKPSSTDKAPAPGGATETDSANVD